VPKVRVRWRLAGAEISVGVVAAGVQGPPGVVPVSPCTVGDHVHAQSGGRSRLGAGGHGVHPSATSAAGLVSRPAEVLHVLARAAEIVALVKIAGIHRPSRVVPHDLCETYHERNPILASRDCGRGGASR